MARFFGFVERIINAVYLTPNPQVQTYFRDLRVVPSATATEDDNDSNYRYTPEPNGDSALSATVGTISESAAQSKLSPRRSGAASATSLPVE